MKDNERTKYDTYTAICEKSMIRISVPADGNSNAQKALQALYHTMKQSGYHQRPNTPVFIGTEYR